MFQEYPKGLCKGGIDGEWRIVADEAEEQEARSEGFAQLGAEVEQPQRKKPGPKPKQ